MMEYSRPGQALTKGFESCRLDVYPDSRGIPTQGWGHTRGITFSSPRCTQEQADAWLLEDEQTATDDVNRLVKVPLTQGEFDALVDFTYNLGGGNFADSTMLRLLNAGDYAGAANQFDLWDHAGAMVVAGLLRRREAEKAEFNAV